MLLDHAEGREVCAAGAAARLSWLRVLCCALRVPRLPLCGCCVTAKMLQAARARGRACTELSLFSPQSRSQRAEQALTSVQTRGTLCQP